MKTTTSTVAHAVRRVLGGIGAAAVVALLVVLGQMEPVENWSLSKLFELRGSHAPTVPVIIVTIDESSISELGQWPFPRALHAQLLQRISAGQPLAIGLDVIFDMPSSRGPDEDLVLGEAIALAGNVVLGDRVTEDMQGFYKRQSLNIPIPEIRRGAAAVAPVNLPPDADGYVRRIPLGIRYADERVTPFDVALYRIATKAGLAAAPLPKRDSILINFAGGPQTFPWVPYYRVVNGEIPPELFAGKIVLLGPTSEVLHDLFPTAFAPAGTMPGIEIHANVLDTFVRGNAVREVPVWLSTLAAVIAGIVASALASRLHAVRALVVLAVLSLVAAAAVFGAFVVLHVWMRAGASMLALVLGYGATVVEEYIREQREKRRLSQFFSPDVLRHVVRERGTSLGSSRRLVTVLFSDIRGFTSISERLQPEQVAEMLREYLTEMTEVVFRHGGTVDKYIGDCVMALYNVPFEDPEHAVNAVRTGLEFQERTLAVSRKWEEALGVTIRNGVGINTGEAVVGTLGSRQRLEYTAIGDTVNLASRLESITKDYGVPIIVSEFTHEHVKGHFMTRELGAVTVKGKTRPVKIFAILPHDVRRYPRTVISAAATVTALDEASDWLVEVTNVSETGVAVRGVPEAWGKGKAIQFRCDGGVLPKPISADGTIVWRRDDLAGIAFTDAVASPGSTPSHEAVAQVTGSTEHQTAHDAPQNGHHDG